MHIKRTQRFPDYRSAMECVAAHLIGGSTIEQSLTSSDYVVTWFEHANSISEMMRIFLQCILTDYELTDEEKDAIAYADSAIKTLVDMGVLK